jgi:hypothetical protein
LSGYPFISPLKERKYNSPGSSLKRNKDLINHKDTKDTKKRKEKGGRWRKGGRKKLKLFFLPFTVSPFLLNLFLLFPLCSLCLCGEKVL